MDETWYTDVTSQEVDKKSNKKWGSMCSFLRHNAYKYGFLGPFFKNHVQPKTEQKGEIFSMIDVAQNST